MMSKFHKTSYSRGGVFAGLSSQGRRNPPAHQQQTEWAFRGDPPQRRVDVESSLMLTHKQPPSDPRKTTNRSEVKLYETASGFNRDRPQSKQEPRSRLTVESKLKTEAVLPERPQTSKGARQCRGKVLEREESDNYEEFAVQVRVSEKKGHMRASQARKGRQEVLAFDTSIDPEFLSLFAN
jgi:hypothetical protein